MAWCWALGAGWAGTGCARSAEAGLRGARGGAAGNLARERGAQLALGRAEQAAACAAGALGRQGAGALGEHDRQAQGARPGFGLCTRCTRPVFGPVRLGIFPESNFWTLFVNPVHEHYSSQNFSKKKYLLNKIKIK